MAKSRKSYKLSRYKTRRNKRSLRKRRKTKKLRGGMGVKGVIKKLNAIKKNLRDSSSLDKKKLEALKRRLLDLDEEPIEFDGETLNPGDDKYDKLKNLIQKYTQIVERKLSKLNEENSPPPAPPAVASTEKSFVDEFYPRENSPPPTPPAVASTEPDDCNGKRVSSSEILASINEAMLKLQQANKCGLAAPAQGGRRKKTRKRRR